MSSVCQSFIYNQIFPIQSSLCGVSSVGLSVCQSFDYHSSSAKSLKQRSMSSTSSDGAVAAVEGDVDGGLAQDLDWSLSGLGVDMNSAAYNMTEALLALPVYRHSDTLENRFQYIMAAPTSPMTKQGEETLTYLNQVGRWEGR